VLIFDIQGDTVPAVEPACCSLALRLAVDSWLSRSPRPCGHSLSWMPMEDASHGNLSPTVALMALFFAPEAQSPHKRG
jgi:hypothetical protein